VEPLPSPDAQQPDENSASLSPSERVPRITAEELFQKIKREENVLIVDTRADVETSFEEGHIPGAVPVTLAQILDKQWVPPSDIEIILYCT
jgi:rhodanese-related sulfurtransferase